MKQLHKENYYLNFKYDNDFQVLVDGAFDQWMEKTVYPIELGVKPAENVTVDKFIAFLYNCIINEMLSADNRQKAIFIVYRIVESIKKERLKLYAAI